MLVIIDKSEEGSNKKLVQEMKNYFKQIKDTQAIVANLPHREHGGERVTSGDVNLTLDNGLLLAIERKTPDDFLNSIKKRHIFHQVEVMATHAKYSVIIVTGYFTYTAKTDMVRIEKEETGWSGASVRAVISEIQFSGCPVIFCPPSEYCNQIMEVYQLVNKGEDERGGVYKNRILTFPPVDERIQFLAQLTGVHIKLADSLLSFAGKMDKNADVKGYGTIAGALHWASILSQIDKSSRPDGWGPAKILTVRKFLGLKSNEYIDIGSEGEENE